MPSKTSKMIQPLTMPEDVTAVAPVAMAPRFVSVVVPLFNERDCVDPLVAALDRLELVLGASYDLEFILVDDGSQDGTATLLERAAATRPAWRVVKHGTNRGVAAAIQTGIRAATYEVVASIDCDGSYDPLTLAELLPLLVPGVDLVTASPYHPLGSVENVPLWRLRLSRWASRLYGAARGHALSCYTSCFRVYRRDSVASIELTNPGFVGVAEMLCRVLEQGGVVVEHPAILRSRIAGTSKMRVVRASLGHMRLVTRTAVARLLRRAPERSRPASGAHQSLSDACQPASLN